MNLPIPMSESHGDSDMAGGGQMRISTNDKRNTRVSLEGEILRHNTEDPMDFWIWLNHRIQQFVKTENDRETEEKAGR